MNKNLELFYILPYTKKYNAGYHYYNDEICCNDYKDASFCIWQDDSLFFETEEQLLKYFYQNSHKPIPEVYKIRYIENFNGMDDVIQITNLGNNVTSFYTILNSKSYACYNFKISNFCRKYVWEDDYISKVETKFRLKDMYCEFSKRGVKLKCDILKKNKDKTNNFEFIGDPYYIVDAIKMKEKQLILYRHNYEKLNWNEIENILKQYLEVEDVNRLLYEPEDILQEIYFGESKTDLPKKKILLKSKNNK